MNVPFRSIITVTLNPTIDRIIEVPGLHIGGHQQGLLRVREPAGKAINVSRALADLGVKSTAVGWVGMNAFDLFHESMQAAGVKACFLPITGLTRENITLIDPRSRSETHIRDAGPAVDTADVRRLTDLLQTVVNEESLVIFTGSLPPCLSVEANQNLIRTCVERGARVAIDAEGEPLKCAVECRPWLVKPNEFELGELVGHSVSEEAALLDAARGLSEHIAVVLITVGKRGAYCLANGHIWHGQASVPTDAIRSTVGCGDAMMAGFLASLLTSGGDVEHALREGVAISAAAALTEEPAHFERDALNRVRRTIELRTLG